MEPVAVGVGLFAIGAALFVFVYVWSLRAQGLSLWSDKLNLDDLPNGAALVIRLAGLLCLAGVLLAVLTGD